MKTLNAGQLSQINAPVRGATLLIDMDFASGTQYVTPFSVPIVANGHTYLAVGNVLSIGAFRESEVLSTDKLTIKVSIVNTAMLAYMVGPASEYRNRAIRIYFQLLDDKWIPVQNPVLRWVGIMDKTRITRNANPEGMSVGNCELICQRSGLSRFRNFTGLRMTHAQQQLDYPGDLGLEYTEKLITSPPPWLTRRFQEQV